MTYTLHLGDCRAILAMMPDDSIDSIVTDPPYELGFMGKSWDASGIAYDVTMWRQCLRVLKPGGHLLSFGGSRTYHRMAVAIEDAGFEIRDQIQWIYGSGFPKSHNLRDEYQGFGTALKPATENIVMAYKPHNTEHDIIIANIQKLEAQLWLMQCVCSVEWSSTLSPSELRVVLSIAQWTAEEFISTKDDLLGQMDTLRLGNVASMCLSIVQSWKSTWEEASNHGNTFITETVLSPIIGWTTLKSSLSHLTLNSIIRALMQHDTMWQRALSAELPFVVASQKLKSTLELIAVERAISRTSNPASTDNRITAEPIVVARKPLIGTVADNVTQWGTGAINIDGCRVKINPDVDDPRLGGKGSWVPTKTPDGVTVSLPRTTLTSSPLGRWPANVIFDEDAAETLDAQSGVSVSSKPSPSIPYGNKENTNTNLIYGKGLATTIPNVAPYGDSGGASRFFYIAKASRAEREAGLHAPDGQRGNIHSTVKPIALMRYLVRLVTPPRGIVLDPFTGSGTTGCAAALEGMDFVGIEQSAEYIAIADARIAHHSAQPKMEL